MLLVFSHRDVHIPVLLYNIGKLLGYRGMLNECTSPKLFDFWSANCLWHTSEQSVAPGNPTYAAPEVRNPLAYYIDFVWSIQNYEKISPYNMGVY